MSEKVVIGVDLGGTNLRAGRVEEGEVVSLRKTPISARGREEVVIGEIIEAIRAVQSPVVAGIGIGVPSIVDVETGIVYLVENIPSWREVHLKEILEKSFGVPVHVNNDANCFALGEAYYGKGRSFRHLVGITIGTGLGAGIIIDRRLYSGRNCGAGEFGCIPYREKTIEYYCSGQYFLRESGRTGDQLYRQAEAGDEAALEIFALFGRELGHAIMTILYALDPEIVVLGGSVATAYRFFSGAMLEKLREYAYPAALQRLKIECSDRPEIPLLGAAALVFDAERGLDGTQ